MKRLSFGWHAKKHPTPETQFNNRDEFAEVEDDELVHEYEAAAAELEAEYL
jgi:hypothetical protein